MLEQRYNKSTLELRDGPNGPMITGYAAVYNSDSENLGGFIEQIDPAAFTKTLQEADVRGLANHDENWLLGRSKPGTLRLASDSIGLRYEIDINTVDPDGQRAHAKVQRRDWDGSSFSFQCVRDQWDWGAQPPRRRVLECALVDVGPVTYPAYPDTTAAARALSRLAEKLNRDPERLALALRSGEIRSLLGVNGDAPEPDVEERELRDHGLEERAVWSTAYKNDLPDSAFLYVEPGGTKDADGKTTPRSLRHLPVKGSDGKVDLPHLRAAITRLSQEGTGTGADAWLTDSLRKTLLTKAKNMLAANGEGESNSLPAGAETRAGKVISAATAAQIRAAMDQLQALLDASDNNQGGGLIPGESNSLRHVLQPALRLLTRGLESRDMPDMGGDADNLAAMTGAVAAAYLTKLDELGLDIPESGFYLRPVGDQDGDADGDGQSLFCVSDNAATWWVVANGDQAEVVAWDGNEWSGAWRSNGATAEGRHRVEAELARAHQRRALALSAP